MTDIEKRAHDLALLTTGKLFDMCLSDNDEYNAKNDIKKDFQFDTFEEYLKTYNAYIHRFNHLQE